MHSSTPTFTRSARHTTVRQALLVLAGSLAIAASARVAIPLPFSPVPITLQTAVVVLVGAALGARGGVAAVLAYIAEGAAGAPFFAGGQGGPGVLLGPTGGYLVGFALSAFIAGGLVERGWGRGAFRPLAAFTIAALAVYLVGLPRLAFFVEPDRVVALGLLPFLPGDLVKVVVAAAVWTAGSRATRG
ncbi:MAG TPA: biotin transporter BioY [Chloroflexota bacterium]|nr:biotin transporter BioY [Chloroflexota bacterium]